MGEVEALSCKTSSLEGRRDEKFHLKDLTALLSDGA